MKRVLVAGATGYLGEFVSRELKSRGYFVRALTRTPGKLDHLKEELDEIRVGEVTKPETLKGICDGIDVVFSSIGITKQKGKLLAFFAAAMTSEVVAPVTGTHMIEEHYREMGAAR